MIVWAFVITSCVFMMSIIALYVWHIRTIRRKNECHNEYKMSMQCEINNLRIELKEAQTKLNDTIITRKAVAGLSKELQ